MRLFKVELRGRSDALIVSYEIYLKSGRYRLEGPDIIVINVVYLKARECNLISAIPVGVRVINKLSFTVGVNVSLKVGDGDRTVPGRTIVFTKVDYRVLSVARALRIPFNVGNGERALTGNSRIVDGGVNDLTVVKTLVRVETGKSRADIFHILAEVGSANAPVHLYVPAVGVVGCH
jgi:hypothetical protein